MTQNSQNERIDLASLREQLAGSRGQQYWRSLEELAETESFQEFLHNEFPKGTAVWNDSVSRRAFMKVMGASLALAGLTACRRQPIQRIAPYTTAPANFVPGRPLYFASAAVLGGFATGVLVESNEYRPTFIQGNPNHPASLGAADVFTQAEILTMYDPERSQVVLNQGTESNWADFLAALVPLLDEWRANQGAGLRILTQTVTSPSLADQVQALLTAYPQAQWHQYDPVGRDNVRVGTQLAFGADVDTIYDFSAANVVLALDSNFLMDMPGSLRYARDFASTRRVRQENPNMSRLYAVEGTYSITGATADHRLPLRSSEIEALTRVLAARLGAIPAAEAELPASVSEEWLAALVADLQASNGASIVLAGANQPPVVHALVHAINQALGNVGTTVTYIEPVEANPVNQTESLRALTDAIAAGQVSTLVILGGNPAYDAPADLEFGNKVRGVANTIHLSLFVDETSALSKWHIPAAHFLEAWGDARAFDGTAAIIQPLIEPLYQGRSAHEVIAALSGAGEQAGYDMVRTYWQNRNLAEGDFDTFWKTALSTGVIPGTAAPTRSVQLQSGFASERTELPAGQIEVMFQPDPTIWDGRYNNNGWLQELPKPLTKLAWDNAALMSVATAEQLGLQNGDVINLAVDRRSVRAPVWITPGHVDNAVTVHLGYGRSQTGQVGTGQGFNAYLIRTSTAPWFAYADIRGTGVTYPLVSSQDHSSLEGRDDAILKHGTLQQVQEHPEEPAFMHSEHHYTSIYPPYDYSQEPNSWGMVIDLTTCIACNACVIACQAENNIPVVGKDQVANGREMHWIRIDRYYSGDLDNPIVLHEPMLCVHCEQAPCETVCPVAATVHDNEGINNMIYNRCVGTRYCSNNCPYKVRRFNFLQYTDLASESLKLMRNPEVTVRNRGVMEKCTYCIQRIAAARITAEKRGNPVILDGEVVTACQAACPTQTITFGNLNAPESQVKQLKAQPLNFSVLEELNTFPRTTHLARVRNPNVVIEPPAPAEEHGSELETAPAEEHGSEQETAPANGHGTE